MAIDPSQTTPTDSATVQSLQSTTEASAKAAMRAPVNSAWGGARFSLLDLLGGIGQILGGAIAVGGQLLAGIVSGVVNFVSGITAAIRGIFGGSSGGGGTSPEPPPPIFSPIQAALEEVLEPKFDLIDDALTSSSQLREDIDSVTSEMDILISDSPDSVLWGLQQQVNELQSERDDLQDIAIEALQEAQEAQLQTISRTIFVPRGVPIENEHFTITYSPKNGNDWRVTAKPGWVGFFIWQSVYSSAANPAIDGFRVGATRQWDVAAWARHQSVITYWVQKGTARTSNVELASPPITVGTGWTRLNDLTFTAPVTAPDYPMHFRIGWENRNYLDYFGLRILVNGSVHWSFTSNHGGPYTGHGYRSQQYNNLMSLQAEDVVHFESYTNTSNSVNRIIRNAWRNTSWVEPFDPNDENPESPD